MSTNDKINYLKTTIEAKLNYQMDFQISEEICVKNKIMSQMSIKEDRHQSDDTNSALIDSWIDAIDKNVKNLGQNQSMVISNDRKQRLESICVDLNNLMVKLNGSVT